MKQAKTRLVSPLSLRASSLESLLAGYGRREVCAPVGTCRTFDEQLAQESLRTQAELIRV